MNKSPQYNQYKYVFTKTWKVAVRAFSYISENKLWVPC